MATPIITIESLEAAQLLIQAAANQPAILLQIDPELERGLTSAATGLQTARSQLTTKIVAQLSHENVQAVAEVSAGKDALQRMKERAEAAEMALGQAVMKQQKVEQDLAAARVEISDLKTMKGKRRVDEGSDLGGGRMVEINRLVNEMTAARKRRLSIASGVQAVQVAVKVE